MVKTSFERLPSLWPITRVSESCKACSKRRSLSRIFSDLKLSRIASSQRGKSTRPGNTCFRHSDNFRLQACSLPSCHQWNESLESGLLAVSGEIGGRLSQNDLYVPAGCRHNVAISHRSSCRSKSPDVRWNERPGKIYASEKPLILPPWETPARSA